MTGKLYLADGSLYQGHGFGAKKTAVGELVFNTSMTGYQEILTDPSYWGQVITMTYPLIGNYGILPEFNQSDGVHGFGLVVHQLCENPSLRSGGMPLAKWMEDMDLPPNR